MTFRIRIIFDRVGHCLSCRGKGKALKRLRMRLALFTAAVGNLDPARVEGNAAFISFLGSPGDPYSTRCPKRRKACGFVAPTGKWGTVFCCPQRHLKGNGMFQEKINKPFVN